MEDKTNLSQEWVNLSIRGGKDRVFPRAGRVAPRDPKEQPCQREENPVLLDSFTQIYILF